MIVPHLPAPYSFAASRHTPVSFGVKKYDIASERTVDMDISAARFSVHLRAWTTRDSTALALDGTISKSWADSAWVDGTMNQGAVERGSLFWEAVLIDSDNTNSDSPSGYLERHLFTFNAPVDPAPVDPVP